jgi:hypothetical protein
MGLLVEVEKYLGDLFALYHCRIVEANPIAVYVVVSYRSLLLIVDHPSEGGLNMGWYLKTRYGWLSFGVLHLLSLRARRSGLNMGLSDDSVAEGLQDMHVLLERFGQDMLNGKIAWREEYEKQVGLPKKVTPDTEDELNRLVAIHCCPRE